MKNKALALLSLLAVLACPAQGAPVEEKDMAAYLFVYFTGNSIDEEAICFGVSTDGYNYYALNGNKPVLDSKEISSTGGVRDPTYCVPRTARHSTWLLQTWCQATGGIPTVQW